MEPKTKTKANFTFMFLKFAYPVTMRYTNSAAGRMRRFSGWQACHGCQLLATTNSSHQPSRVATQAPIAYRPSSHVPKYKVVHIHNITTQEQGSHNNAAGDHADNLNSRCGNILRRRQAVCKIVLPLVSLCHDQVQVWPCGEELQTRNCRRRDICHNKDPNHDITGQRVQT